MKKLFIFSLFLISFQSIAQISRFSIEVNFPLLTNNNLLNRNFDGVVDLGVKYRFLNAKIINIGGAFNGSLLQDDTNESSGVNIFAYVLQPKAFAELNLLTSKFHPFIELGYTLFIQSANVATGLNNFNDTRTQNGLNANIGFSYIIIKQIFVQIQYNFIRLLVENNFPSRSLNRNLDILKLGLGFRL